MHLSGFIAPVSCALTTPFPVTVMAPQALHFPSGVSQPVLSAFPSFAWSSRKPWEGGLLGSEGGGPMAPLELLPWE